MSQITFKKVNAVYSQMICESGILYEIAEVFEKFVPKYKFSPSYKKGQWDGKIRFLSNRTGKFYTGLLQDVWLECKRRGYNEFKFEGYDKTPSFTKESITERLQAFQMPFEFRDYQLEAIEESLIKKRRTILSATSSGKSAIIYAITRILIEDGNKVLLIVPNVSLVSQMYKDFGDYSKDDPGYDVEENVHKVFGGQDKNSDKPMICSTWQSINAITDKKERAEYLAQFDVVLGDECHQCAAKVLTGILEYTVNAEYRVGFTGTLDDESNTLKEGIVGLFGKPIQVSTTKELMDAGKIAKLDIKAIVLNYPEETRKLVRNVVYSKVDELKKVVKTKAYNQELDTVVGHANRNMFITNLCGKLDGNVLVLVRYVEKHGAVLEKLIAQHTGKQVFLLTGETESDIRDDVKALLETIDNAVIIASYGLFSTGISIVNLKYLITASPTKSKIRILQSIGRILRLSKTKTHATLFDIVDDLTYKGKRNYLMDHFKIRYDYYIAEGFDVTFKEIEIG